MFLLLLLLPPTSTHEVYYRPDCSKPSNYTTLPCNSSTTTHHFQTQPDTCSPGCKTGPLVPDTWYRLGNMNITEVLYEEVKNITCVGTCECEVHIAWYSNTTQFPASSYYTVVVEDAGTCSTPLEDQQDHDRRFIEKYDCEGFYLYRFPDNFNEVSCNSGNVNVALVAVSAVSGGVLISLLSALVVLTLRRWRRRKPSLPPPRVRRQPTYNVPAVSRISTHSYADLASLGYNNPHVVQVPATKEPPPPSTTPQAPVTLGLHSTYINMAQREMEVDGYLTPDELLHGTTILSNPAARDHDDVSRDHGNESRDHGDDESRDHGNESRDQADDAVPGQIVITRCSPTSTLPSPTAPSCCVSECGSPESRDHGYESRDHGNVSPDTLYESLDTCHTVDPLSRIKPSSSKEILEELSAIPLPNHYKAQCQGCARTVHERLRRFKST